MNTATISARFGAVALLHAVLIERTMLGDAVQNEDGPISKLAQAIGDRKVWRR